MVVNSEKDDILNQNGSKLLFGSKIIEVVSGMNRESELTPLGLRRKAVFRQVLTVVLANLSVLSGGLALGYPAVTLQQLENPNEPAYLSKSQASWFASITAIACPVGALLSACLLDKIGRKKVIILINITSIISWTLMATAYQTDSAGLFVQIMIARFIVGITTGLASSPVGVYSAEVCHPKLRGRLTLGTSIGTAAGILAIYVLGYFIRNDWHLISWIACGYSMFAASVILHIPESPTWLCAKGRLEEARKSLKYFRGIKRTDQFHYDEFEIEFNNMVNSTSSTDGGKQKRFYKLLKEPEAYKPLLIMIGFFAFQQFSGIFVVIVYAVKFATEAGVHIDPVLCAIYIGLTRILTTFFVGIISDKYGRRPLAISSGIGMCISMFTLASVTWFPAINAIPYLPVVCIVLFIFTSTLGFMTLPFAMISEVYPQKVRGVAAGITICCCFLMSFAIIKIYPSMVEAIGPEYVFGFFGIVSLFAVIYVYIFLPETKGKSFAEIEEYFKYGKNGKSNYSEEKSKQSFM